MKKIIALLLLTFSFSAHAYTWQNGSGVNFSSASAACSAVLPGGYTFHHIVDKGGNIYGCWATNPSSVVVQYTNLTRSGAACVAPDVYDTITGACSAPPPPVCTPGREFSVTVSQGFKIAGTSKTSDMKAPSNVGGCRVYPGAIEECKSAPSGEVFCTWRVTEGGIAPTGETPGSAATAPGTATPDKVPEFNPAVGQGCPKGTVSLGIDSTGGSICGGSGTSPTDPPKIEVKQPTTTTTNADGSTTKVETTTRTNTDGSTTTTTKTTTTGTDGKVTTTEGSVTGNKPGGAGGAGGGKGTEDSKDEDKNDLCKQHPELNICKNSEVSAGACSGGTDSTSCTGDAIQCAILREQKKQWCELQKENPSSTLGKQVVDGKDPIKSTLPTKDNAVTINMQTLDQGGFLGGGACFQDKSISMMGRSVVLPFSNVCPYLEWLRYVIMLIAALVSFRIISKPVLGD